LERLARQHLRQRPLHRKQIHLRTPIRLLTSPNPTLITENADNETIHDLNESKGNALAQSFFPPPPADTSVPIATAYPRPLNSVKFFTRQQIRDKIQSLSPYKAPGPNRIPNIVLIKCTDTIINHLFFIYRAIMELDVYYEPWLHSTTVVLRKPGKPSYTTPKAYRPIGLLDTIGKLFSTLVADDLSFLSESHNLLPAHQFGGRRARMTTDSIHLVTYNIKQAWRRKKNAAALYLDVQGTFPNTVKTVLLHNMRSRRVPEKYVAITERLLTNRFTVLRFDDYTSNPIPLNNGTTQGCCLSMIFYAFYNAPLMEIASGPNEISAGFVDNVMFLATGDTLDEAHMQLKDMMERPAGGFSWSNLHNSPFELSKLALMEFPRTNNDQASNPLLLNKPNHDNTISTQEVRAVSNYKYLGVHFDPKLQWKNHFDKVIANATRWTNQFCRLGRVPTGICPAKMLQLYLTVAVPRFTYAADVWYRPVPPKQDHQRRTGSIHITKKLNTIQCRATIAVVGGMRTTAGDTLEAHANIFPPHLMLNKACSRAVLRLASLPPTHLLFKPVQQAARRRTTRHLSPLHELFKHFDIQPKTTENINPTRQRSNFCPALKTTIQPTKEKAIEDAKEAIHTHQIRLYSDGSSHNGGVGAAATLYVGSVKRKTLRYYLGPDTEHTVYEAEAIGLLLCLYLLTTLTRRLHNVFIGLDNQPVIKALNNQHSKASHHILDKIHNLAAHLQAQEDSKINIEAKRQAKVRKEKWTPRTRNVFNLDIHWVPGHADVLENEAIDIEAKAAAEGRSSQAKDLPTFLRKNPLPTSVSAKKQQHTAILRSRWNKEWLKSKRFHYIRKYNQTLPSPIYMKLTNQLTRQQISLLTQLRTGHVPLNQHLHCINVVPSPNCPHCPYHPETIKHFLLRCPHYYIARNRLVQELKRSAYVIPRLLSGADALPHLFQYIHDTKQLATTFGGVEPAE
jgi:ribonuclease HI